MKPTSRRKFLAALPALGAGAVLVPDATAAAPVAASSHHAAPDTRIPLEFGWQFRLGEITSVNDAITSSAGWKPVTVPHTWQTLGRSPDYVGPAIYALDFDAPLDWRHQCVRIEFESVFHTAHVSLNGMPVGEHIGKGYTAFTCDLSSALRFGVTNSLRVRVDNTPSGTMLPRLKFFDWTNDGGITRPVSLLISPPIYIERIEIDSDLDLAGRKAVVAVRAIVRNTLPLPQRIHLAAQVQLESNETAPHTSVPAEKIIPARATVSVPLPAITVDPARFWHFDTPHLYTADVFLQSEKFQHSCADTFGLRRFETRGTQFLLNGEPVRLMGVERSAGSHPEFGMAEPTAWIHSNLRDMKELNCVFSRVHWQQDRRVLDFCDRHGILMQEEVPCWGGGTFAGITEDVEQQLIQNGLEQLREMIARDRNHPCIITWGLCNEVNGKNPLAQRFAHALSAEARRLDPSRLQTYASNSLNDHPEADMAGDFDFVSINEYYGTWFKGDLNDAHASIARIHSAFPNKPLVISEYGRCECMPNQPVGDAARVQTINQHTEMYRDFPEIAGAIFFDYNDYRTLIGDKGIGAFRQRVHGVVDLYANRKPSFDALRRQSSPIESLSVAATPAGFTAQFTTRRTLPGYSLRGYRLRWVVYGYDDLPMDGRFDDLQPLSPGDALSLSAAFAIKNAKHITVDVLRPSGVSAATATLRLN